MTPWSRIVAVVAVFGAAGFALAAEYVAKPEDVAEVSYTYKRPGSDVQEPKVSLVTKVDDQVCAVGYYLKVPAK